MINFPTNPVDNEEFTSAGKTWVYVAAENSWKSTTAINGGMVDLVNYYTKPQTEQVAEDTAIVFGVALG